MVDVGMLKVFAVVADLRSFSKAATLLSVTQSAVSQTIAQLERQYGIRLFDRIPPRQIKLTPQGEVLLAYSRSLLAGNERLDFVFSHFEALREVEELKLAIALPLVEKWGGRILSALYAINPLLHVIVCTMEAGVEADFYIKEDGLEASEPFLDHPLCEYLKNYLKNDKNNLQG